MELAMLIRFAFVSVLLGLSIASTTPVIAAKSSKEAAGDKSKEPKNAPLIPREVLFGNPQRAQARLSHDGKWISYQAPVAGVLNIWVAPVDDLSKAEAVTKEKGRPITSYHWAYDNKHIVYVNDKNGDE